MSDSEENCEEILDRPSANTRSKRNSRSLEDLTAYEPIEPEFLLESSQRDIPNPNFQLPITPPIKYTQQLLGKSFNDLTAPCSVAIHRLESRVLHSFSIPPAEPIEKLIADSEKLLASLSPGFSKLERRKRKDRERTSDSETNNMTTLSYTDIITAIPIFEGHQKDLDYFISTCSTYSEIVTAEQKPLFLSIVKTKLKGIALTKMQPFSELTTWASIKTRLEEKFKRPLNFETAQDEISSVRQGRNDSIEVYGNNIRFALHKLNKASETLTTDAEALTLLRTANEKLATRKFEQGLYNINLKLCVGAKDYKILDAAISYAMQKESLYKNESRIRCNYCNILGHTENECRRKQQGQNRPSRGNDSNNRYKQWQPYPPNKIASNPSNNSNNNSNGNSNNFRGGNSSNRWENGNNNGNGRSNDNMNRQFYSPGNPNNNKFAPRQNASFDRNVLANPPNARKFTERTITLDEALQNEAKN